jgi:hypothetical protein
MTAVVWLKSAEGRPAGRALGVATEESTEDPKWNRALVGVLAIFALVLLSDSAQSSSHVRVKVRMLDFDKQSNIVVAYPGGSAPPAWFKRIVNTRFVPGVPGTRYPPNPCRRIAIVWNFFSFLEQRDGKTDGDFAPVFEALLTQMGEFQCNADVVHDSTGNPSDIVSITPAP